MVYDVANEVESEMRDLTTTTSNKVPANSPWGDLPPRLSVLFITSPDRTGGWLADSLAADSAISVDIEEACGAANALARLREDVFDVVLIGHDPHELDALEIIDAVRAGTDQDQPVLVLGDCVTGELAALCYDVGGDGYLCVKSTTTRELLWHFSRVAERHQLVVRNRQFALAHKQRLQLEHNEADRLLAEKRLLIEDMRDVAEYNSNLLALSKLTQRYVEFLKAFVVMGSGNLSVELERFVRQIHRAKLNATDALQMHVDALSKIVSRLGNRSARHIMNRAEQLILQVLLQLSQLPEENIMNSASGSEFEDRMVKGERLSA